MVLVEYIESHKLRKIMTNYDVIDSEITKYVKIMCRKGKICDEITQKRTKIT